MGTKFFILVVLCTITAYVRGDDVVLNNHTFKDVKVGVATAAYQIEGAWNESGKGENMWDWFMHTYPDKIDDKQNGDVACNSYHNWDQDITLLKDLGVDHYRFSISWSRILPDGLANNFTINQEGIAYYKKILQDLTDANITPYVTLYHWDLPLPLHELGGWMNPIIADHFAAYARICFEQFGDVVKNWLTINEPQTYCVLGYETGAHAPGFELKGEGIYRCVHTTLLAHAKAYRIYENEFKAKQKGRVSIVLNTGYAQANNATSDKDKAAVIRENAFSFGLYADPIYLGNWPETVINIVSQRSALQNLPSSRLPQFTDDEITLIKGTSDFFALNSYATYLIAHKNNVDEDIADISLDTDKGTTESFDPSWDSAVDWVNLNPSGFRSLLNYVHTTYNPTEIIVTENGWASKDDETTTDAKRTTYVKENLSALLDARYTDGVNVTGYTVWSLMDNLEWSHGYTQKLGLVKVDFTSPDRTRTKKDSYNWLKTALNTRCLLDNSTMCT